MLNLHNVLIGKVENILPVCLHTLIFFLRANDEFVEIAETCTCRNQLTKDYVLLQTNEMIHLSADCCLVENLGGLLERCGRHEALGLESRTGDTLEYLC